MGQLNVTVDDAMLAGIDRLAAERGINRQELVRELVREAMGAAADGSLAFRADHTPVDVSGISEAAHRLGQLSMDLDRALRDQDRREGRLTKALAVAKESNRAGFEGLAIELLSALTDAHRPIRQELGHLETLIRERDAAAPDPAALDRVERDLGKMARDVGAVRTLLTGATRASTRDWVDMLFAPLLAFLGTLLALALFVANHREATPPAPDQSPRTITCADEPSACGFPETKGGVRHDGSHHQHGGDR